LEAAPRVGQAIIVLALEAAPFVVLFHVGLDMPVGAAFHATTRQPAPAPEFDVDFRDRYICFP